MGGAYPYMDLNAKYKNLLKKQFSNTKSIVKIETGIVTLISYRHYLKIVGMISYDQICKKKVEIFT
jgi:hypothetical protein